MNKTFFSFFITIFLSQILFGQEYNVYKSKIDTAFVSSYLGYEKKFSFIFPVDWQINHQKKYPLFMVFDKQNIRSNINILNILTY